LRCALRDKWPSQRQYAALDGFARCAAQPHHSTSSGHGTMVDFTVFMAIASAPRPHAA
jgi:hypothetical protein